MGEWWRPEADRLYRRITVLTADGRVDVEVRGSRTAADRRAPERRPLPRHRRHQTAREVQGKASRRVELTTKPSEIDELDPP